MFEPNSTIGWATGRLTATTRDLLSFLRAPKLADKDLQRTGKPADLIWLFAVNCMIVAAIAIVLFPVMLAFDVSMSNSMAGLFQRPVWQLLLIVVIVGPIVEELMFRSWLSGSPRLLIPVSGLLLWMGLTYSYEQLGWPGPAAIGTAPLLALYRSCHVDRNHRILETTSAGMVCPVFPRWFSGPRRCSLAPCMYSTMPVTIPRRYCPLSCLRTVGGLIWGYARIRYGWWANIAMHMAYNLIATSGLVYVLLTRPDML